MPRDADIRQIGLDGGALPGLPPTSLDTRILNPQNGVSWSTVGVKTVVVTATNEYGLITGTHTIIISADIPVTPTAATIAGPTTGLPDDLYDFLVTVDPEDVTLPIWYTVDYTGLANPIAGPLIGTFPLFPSEWGRMQEDGVFVP